MRAMRKLTIWMVGATVIGTTASQAELVFRTARGPIASGNERYMAVTTTVENVESEFHTLRYESRLGARGRRSTVSGIGQLTNADGSVTNTFGSISDRTGSLSMAFSGFTTNGARVEMFANNDGVGVGLRSDEGPRFNICGGQAFEVAFDLSGMQPAGSSIFMNKAAFIASGIVGSSGLDFVNVSKNSGPNLVVASNNTEVAVGVEIDHGDVIRFENIASGTAPSFRMRSLIFDSVANTSIGPIPLPESEIEFPLFRGPDTNTHRKFEITTTTVGKVESEQDRTLTYDSVMSGEDDRLTGYMEVDFTGVRTNVWGVGRAANTIGQFYDGTTGSFAMTFEAVLNVDRDEPGVIQTSNQGMYVSSGLFGDFDFNIHTGEAIRVTFDLSGLRPDPSFLTLNSISFDRRSPDLVASDMQFLLGGVDISTNVSLSGRELTFSGANIQNGHTLEIRNVRTGDRSPTFGLGLIRFGPGQVDRYEQWKALYNLLGEDAEDDADPDGDLLPNIYEYGLGGDPTNAADTGHSVQYTVIEKGVFEYVYPQRKHAQSGIQYYIETDNDLIFPPGWTNTGYTVTGMGDTSALEFEAVTNAIPIGGNDKQFIRLIIEPTP